MSETRSITGRTRHRTTRPGVVIANKVARVVITAGGIGTILAVLGVCLFLVWVVIPLFQPARLTPPTAVAKASRDSAPLHLALDEYQVLAWELRSDGLLRSFRLDDGQVVKEQELFPDRDLTSVSIGAGGDAAFGFADGEIQLGQIAFKTRYLPDAEVPPQVLSDLVGAQPGLAATLGSGVIQLTPQGQFRLQELGFTPGRAKQLGEGPIRAIRHANRSSGPVVVALVAAPTGLELKGVGATEKEDFLTGHKTLAFKRALSLPLPALAPGAPRHLQVDGSGKNVYVAWEEGSFCRINIVRLAEAFVAERGRLVPAGDRLTVLELVLGGGTLAWGDSAGRVRAGFLIRVVDLQAETRLPGADRAQEAEFAFAITKELADAESAVTALAPSSRSRLLAAGFQDGSLRLFNVTNESELARLPVSPGAPLHRLTMSPKEDGILAAASGSLFHSALDPLHPEATFGALFRPVWYEGYPEAQHTWQSSSGHTGFEPKLGLMPLVFGTLKATFYSMLFGAPLALAAAVFTSEFLRPRAKAVIKPTIELMASLPSVVLGFLAALVFAPFVEKVLPSALATFLTVPFCYLLCAYLWQLLPPRISLHLETWRLAFMFPPLLLSFLMALLVGPLLEHALFSGDLRAWLAWDESLSTGTADPLRGAAGGWLFLTFPLAALATAIAFNRFVTPRLRALAHLDRPRLALLDLAKFGAGVLTAVLLALLISWVLAALGLDPRGTYLDTYVQRNALVVGFVMGFAIIPIIYTIADDALTAVPDHLRSASLGAGATRWQTATRIVIPTAMSGLFSALMIGLGRAVGETMIVLMAAGNTPVMEWNIFEGFRTLSANIAVELPEAVQHSTHYRTLFLAALALFAMTFAVNTVAEVVRLRFRKRAVEL